MLIFWDRVTAGWKRFLDGGPIDTIEKARAFLRRVLLIGLPIFVIYNVFNPWPSLRERSLFVMIVLLIVFLDPGRHRGSKVWLFWDTANSAIVIIVFGYLFLNWEPIITKVGVVTTFDILLGMFAVYVSLLATWRKVGKTLFIMVVLFLVYVFFGQYLPPVLGGHTGYGIQRVFSFMVLGNNGLLGMVIGVALKYLVLFFLLGTLLRKTGALDFIMDLARTLFSRGKTAPALMAVFSSGMVGSITGSSSANVMLTGNITIPLMKKVGLKPELAGAIEATASTGSQIMPPVMGFAAFFMVALLGVDYFDVIRIAFIPALLYFGSVAVAVAVKVGSMKGEGLPGSGLRLATVIFRVSGITFLGTVGILVTLLAMRYSIQLSVIYAISFAFISSMFGRDRITVRKAVSTFEDTGRDSTDISVVCLVVGLVAGSVLLTGLAAKIPRLLLAWSGGYFLPLLFFTMLACLILGTGLPSAVAYLIVAITVSSSLVNVGIPILSAHMFVFYFSNISSITPPVAFASFVAAAVAKADFWKTGLLAFLLAIPGLLIPYALILRPGLTLSGNPFDIIGHTLLTAAGVSAVAAAFSMTRGKGLEFLSQAALGIGGILLALFPIGLYTIIGGVLCLPAGRKVIGGAMKIFNRH